MKKTFFLFLLCSLWVFAFISNAQERVIFDSDLSSDWDDVGDIAMLNSLADLGEVEILACMASSDDAGTAVGLHAINTYYGRPDIPCGTRVQDNNIGGKIPASFITQFPHLASRYKTAKDCPLAVDLYRQVLASQPDNSVTIITAGFLTNLDDLMKSGPDSYSPLNGMELIRKKVKLFACTGGDYPYGTEFNFAVVGDVAAYVINNWPQEVPARFVGFNIGQCVMSGAGLPATPATNPVRYVYVDSRTNGYPHPTWTQIMIYSVIRPEEAEVLWDYVTTGYNTCLTDETRDPNKHWETVGTSLWIADGQNHNQKYFLEKQRYPIQESVEALIMNSGWPKSGGTVAPPNMPGHLRAEVKSDNTIELKWSDNSWNETGFIVERKIANGNFEQIAITEENVTTCTDETSSQTANVIYRVKASNSTGDSDFSQVALYEWEEHNFSTNPDLPYTGGLYAYYNNHLRWNQGTDYRPNHLVLNKNSTHEKNLLIDVHVGALNNGERFYVYFFYQDINNWYRLAVEGQTARFEKKIAGGAVQVITSGNIESEEIGSGSQMQPWIIEVSDKGTMSFFNYKLKESRVQTECQEILNVTNEVFAFNSGKIALGGDARTPLWQNFYFDAAYTGGNRPVNETPPAIPTGLEATAGNGQIRLSWTSGSRVTSYSVYRGMTSNGQDPEPIAAGLTSTNYIDTGLSNGTACYYKVRAVNEYGSSGDSKEAVAIPRDDSGLILNFANDSFEIPSLSGGFTYNPEGSSWTFTNNAGIQHNGSAYSGDVSAPNGVQTGFVQSVEGKLGTMSQSVNFPAGIYKISFMSARRWGTIQPIQISVGGTIAGTYTPSGSSFEQIITDEFSITSSGNYTVIFAATDDEGDKTSFIDLVGILSVATGITPVSASTNDIISYPNPANDIVYFSENVPEISLFSLQGQIVVSARNSNSLDVSSLPRGLYIMRLKNAAGFQKSTKIEVR
jgi:hypothetical protein